MSICILTDKSALFPTALSGTDGHIFTFPLTSTNEKLRETTIAEFQRLFFELETRFEALLILTASEKILPGARAAWQAAQTHGGSLKISVLDTQQIGAGVGLLAQLGARTSVSETSLPKVEERLRAAIPHIYTLLCPEFSPAGAPEEPGNFPIYIIEDGELNIYKKVRTRRHLLEALQEFIEEFEKPQQIAYFHGSAPRLRSRPLRGTVGHLFPETAFTEIEINLTLSNLFGPQTVGLTLMELPNENRTRD